MVIICFLSLGKMQINLHFLLLIRNSDFVENRLHLGNPKKNIFFFGISLGLHYLCKHKSKNNNL